MAEQLQLADQLKDAEIDVNEAKDLADTLNTADKKKEKKDINDVLGDNIDKMLISLEKGVNIKIQEAEKLIKDIGDTQNIDEDNKWKSCNEDLKNYKTIYGYLKMNVVTDKTAEADQINNAIHNIFGNTLILEDGPDARRQKNQANAERIAAENKANAEKAESERIAAENKANAERIAAENKANAEKAEAIRKIEKPTMDEVNKKILEAKEPFTKYDFNSMIQYSHDNARQDVLSKQLEDPLTPFLAYSQIAKFNLWNAAYTGFFQAKDIGYQIDSMGRTANADNLTQNNQVDLKNSELYNIDKIDSPQSAAILSLVMVANANPNYIISKKILRGCPLVVENLGDPAGYHYEITKGEVATFLSKYENQFKNIYNSFPIAGGYKDKDTILNMGMLFTDRSAIS